MLKSTKLPAGMLTLPVAEQDEPELAEHASAVSDRLLGAPARSVTVIVFDCIE